MTRLRLLELSLAATALLLVGANVMQCLPGDPNPDLGSLSDADFKTLTISLERQGCYGSCPAYVVKLEGTGRVVYEGKDHIKEKGNKEGRVEIDKIKALIAEFANANFWALPDEYTESKCNRYCTDMPTAITELSLRGRTRRVKHYYGCGGVPKALFDLESAIDKSVKVEQWTGDVSKAGPFGTTCWNPK